MTLYWLAFAFKATAALFALAVALKHAEHRPVSWLVVGSTAGDLARLALNAWWIRPAREALRAAGLDPATVPFTGWPFVACVLEGALFLAWFAGIAALALWLFLRRRPWPVLTAYALAVLALVVFYPALRHDALRRFYLAAELAAVGVGVGAFAQWIGREAPRLPHVVMACILAVELAGLVAGPWRFDLFGVAWTLAHVMYAALYAVLIVLQTGALWISPTSSRS